MIFLKKNTKKSKTADKTDGDPKVKRVTIVYEKLDKKSYF